MHFCETAQFKPLLPNIPFLLTSIKLSENLSLPHNRGEKRVSWAVIYLTFDTGGIRNTRTNLAGSTE